MKLNYETGKCKQGYDHSSESVLIQNLQLEVTSTFIG